MRRRFFVGGRSCRVYWSMGLGVVVVYLSFPETVVQTLTPCLQERSWPGRQECIETFVIAAIARWGALLQEISSISSLDHAIAQHPTCTSAPSHSH